jgi:glycosyltransferase involved in cell wall biosynthesis
MKILITNSGLDNFAGTEMYTYTLALSLISRGHKVVCYTSRPGKVAEKLEQQGISVIDCISQLKDEFDVIHGQHFAETLEAAFYFPKTPIFQVIHGVLPWQEQPVPSPIVDNYVVVSEEIKGRLISHYGIAPGRIRIIRNPIDTNRFSSKKPVKLPVKKVLFISNKADQKTLQIIKTACQMGGLELSLAGTIEKPVWRIEEEIERADLVITLGRGVLEASAMKRPVIVFDYNGGDGLVTKENFYILRERNFSGRFKRLNYSPEELLNEISLVTKDQIESVYDLVVADHNIDIIAKQFEEYYLEICQLPFTVRDSLQTNKVYVECLQRIVSFKNKDYNQAQDNLKYLTELNSIQTHQIEEKNKEIIVLKSDIEYLDSLLQERSMVCSTLESKLCDIEKNYNEVLLQLNQKEDNLRYLLELNSEKERELLAIYSSRAWKLITFYRIWKNRFKQGIRNPYWAIQKLKNKVFGLPIPINEVRKPNNVSSSNPLISVVIPIYDREQELRESIESILNQTFQNFELILVCDGSPPGTLKVVDEYKDHPKVRIFKYFNNSGNAVRGRNKAIKEARGRYLAFQDSDDIAEPNRLEISLKYLEEYDVDVVYGGWRAYMDGSRKIEGLKDGQEIMSPDCDFEMLKEVCVPCQSTVMCKLDALRKVGGFKTVMRYREDHELWLRLAYFGYRFKAIPKVLTNLRLHSHNLELTFKDNDNYWFQLMQEEYKIIRPLGPKIGYVIPGCGISGGIAVICQHVNRLLRRGYDVVMISEDGNTSIDWFPNQKVQVIPLKEADDNFDILVATGWSTAYTVRNMNAKRKFYFVQSDESRFYPQGSREQKLAMESYKFDFEYLTEALWIKRWLKEKFNHEAVYVPNGLDEQIFHATTPLEPKGDKVRVLLEGPIDIPFKGMEDAFKAVEGLDCEVWCISSSGKPKPEWKCDRFFEKVPMEKMKEVYSSCDILLKLSRVEGFFGPPMEMMACGGTAVVGDVTGHDEYIIDGYNALVVPLGDISAAHLALKRLISDPKLRARLIENGRKTADQWKWEPTIDILEKVFFPEKFSASEIDNENLGFNEGAK